MTSAQSWLLRAPLAGGPIVGKASPPSFSVIVPAFQAAGTVAEAVRSALKQTLEAVEVIVVDDGSTDDLAGALRGLPSVRLLRRPHRGLAAARNAGVGVACGDFVAFLDADDVYAPDHLRALGWASAVRPDLDILTADATFIRGEKASGSFYRSNPFPEVDQRQAVLTRCFLHANSAVRRSSFLAVNGSDETFLHGEDWDLWVRLILSGSRAGLVDHPLVEYRLHGASMSANLVASYRSRPRVLLKTLKRRDLSPTERDIAIEALRRSRRRAAKVAASELRGLAARRGWLTLATSREATIRMRAEGLAGIVAPGWVAGREQPRGGPGSTTPDGHEQPRSGGSPSDSMTLKEDGGAQ